MESWVGPHEPMSRLTQSARWVLPFVVSAGTLAFVLQRIDIAVMLTHLDANAARILVPALLAYGAVTLWLDSQSLVLLVSDPPESYGFWTALRIKSASYLFGLLHYTLAAGSLTVLLRRRAGVSLSDAAGVVGLVSVLDLGMLIALPAIGAAFVSAQAPALQAGVIAAGIAAIVGGFALLRAPISLGPLERVRRLELFRVTRTSPPRLLFEVGILRLSLVGSFISLAWAALTAFGISVPPGDLIVNVTAVALVAALPVAVAGLGTGQVAFVYIFRHWADPETLLACSFSLSAGLILMRGAIGLAFAREFTREALTARRESQAEGEA